MRKRSKGTRSLALLLVATLLMGAFALPIYSVSEGVSAYTSSRDAPTSVPDDIITVTKNPYDVDVKVVSYPVMTSERYNSYSIWGVVNGVETRIMLDSVHSPYYTASVGVWYDHNGIDTRDEQVQIESKLPYREEEARCFIRDWSSQIRVCR